MTAMSNETFFYDFQTSCIVLYQQRVVPIKRHLIYEHNLANLSQITENTWFIAIIGDFLG